MAYITLGAYLREGQAAVHNVSEHCRNYPPELRARALALSRRAHDFLLRLGPDGLDMAAGCLEIASEYLERARAIDGTEFELPPAAEAHPDEYALLDSLGSYLRARTPKGD